MFRRRRQQPRLATQTELPPLLDFPFGQDPLRFAPQTDLPPLLDLPPHLLQQILNHLDEPHDLSLMFLRRTHPILRALIPWGYSSNRQIKKCQLWTAEREHPELLPQGFYPCYSCLEVYPRRCFERRYRDEDEEGSGGRVLERRCKFCTRVWERRFLSGKRIADIQRRARL